MILLIDNYDSFSYNLYQYIGTINPDIKVVRNDALTVPEIEALAPECIILSPGPGYPKDAGVCIDVVKQLGSKIPILGVCLGHQAICEAFGATVGHARQLMHGKQSTVTTDQTSVLFSGIEKQLQVARYHSLAALADTMPDELKVTARTKDGEVMAVQHVEYPIFGVQFHPESIMTPRGMLILRNFLDFARNPHAAKASAAPEPQELTASVASTQEGSKKMIQTATAKLVDKQDLSYDEAYGVIDEIMSGETTPTQTAAFLAALSTKSTKAETIEEIAGCADAMRAKATRVDYDDTVLDIVGTGGDKAGSFNISTTAAFVIAAGGVKVAKHGNRAASSKSGTADVQEALGANIDQGPEKAKRMLDSVGMTFFFAQKYHSAMKYVGPIRKELGIRTVFNILGPLTNPISPTRFVLGVYDGALVEPLAKVLTKIGVTNGLVVHGQAGLDELSTACPTDICEIKEGYYKSFTITPDQYGFKQCTRDDLKGGTPEENAQITRDILDGKDHSCKRDTVVLNAAAGLYAGGVVSSLAAGIARAEQLIDSGAAAKKMAEYIAVSNED